MKNVQQNLSCFIISAFGTKSLIKDRNSFFDFDAFSNEIKAAVLLYQSDHPDVRISVQRADELSSGAIVPAIYKQLYYADIVIAEVSCFNLNVYYELGIRLALKRRVTIVLAQKGTPLPFDINDVRVITYEQDRLLSNNIRELHKIIENRLAGEEDSPFYIAMPDVSFTSKAELDIMKDEINTFIGINQNNDYGIRIDSHSHGAFVGEWFTVSGTFQTAPPENSARLFNRSLDGYGYWPQSIVTINNKNNSWTGKVHFGNRPPEQGEVIISIVGKECSILWDYYYKVGKETGHWPSIQTLTDDFLQCDSVTLIKPKRWYNLFR